VSETMEASPFHRDELEAQARAGHAPKGAGIRNFMPDQHRSFFPLLPYLFVATTDANGWPLATRTTGRFLQPPWPSDVRSGPKTLTSSVAASRLGHPRVSTASSHNNDPSPIPVTHRSAAGILSAVVADGGFELRTGQPVVTCAHRFVAPLATDLARASAKAVSGAKNRTLAECVSRISRTRLPRTARISMFASRITISGADLPAATACFLEIVHQFVFSGSTCR